MTESEERQEVVVIPGKGLRAGRLLAAGMAPLLISAGFGFGAENQPSRTDTRLIHELQNLDSQKAGEDRSDGPKNHDNADSSPESLEAGPPDQRESWMGPLRIFKRLGAPGGGLSSLARSLVALTDATRAPFSRKTRLRLSPEALDEVQLGSFAGASRASLPLASNAFHAGAPEGVLRVVSWNIERGLQYEKIVQALKEDLPADLYLLQEVDQGARRTERRDVAKSLARELGMYFAFGTEFQELIQGRDPPALHGQAILSRFPISGARVLRFEHQPKDWSRDWFQPRNGGRMALVAEIATPRGSLLVYNAHLESRGSDEGRARQMEEIIADIRHLDYRGPVVVAGDLNTGAGFESQVFELANRHGIRLLPFQTPIPPSEARRQKDWILGANITSSHAVIEDQVSASDHKPVTAELRLQ